MIKQSSIRLKIGHGVTTDKPICEQHGRGCRGHDHIIPPDCSRALGAKIGSRDYTEIPLPGGHVGLFVSSKSQGKLSQSIADWLVARDATSASKA